ncbi:hypothetical protein M5689_014179 [Euphorbia peplus]|nr:hypothetical protein M5689_014179 [Euphorbia peplus]
MAIQFPPLRSISLPCRIHPNSLKIEQDLKSFKSLSFSSNNSSTFESIQIGLTRLAELFISIHQLNHSSQTIHHQNQNQVEQLLDRSVALIDICSTIRDMFLTMQEHVQGLQSALRRRGKDSGISSNIQAYVSFRKQTKKTIAKSLRTLKRFESVTIENHPLIDVTREAHGVATNIFQSLLMFLSLPVHSNTKWSIVSKLIGRSGFADHKDHDRDQRVMNEVESVDVALCSISKFDVEEVQGRLLVLSVIIEEFEGKLDNVFRCLIQNRVSLLNLLTP